MNQLVCLFVVYAHVNHHSFFLKITFQLDVQFPQMGPTLSFDCIFSMNTFVLVAICFLFGLPMFVSMSCLANERDLSNTL